MVGQRMTPAQADALVAIVRRYHAGLKAHLASGHASEAVRAEAYRVGLVLDEIDNPPTPAPAGVFNRKGDVK